MADFYNNPKTVDSVHEVAFKNFKNSLEKLLQDKINCF